MPQQPCRICGQVGQGPPFDEWVRDTFVDWDKIGTGEIICQQCLFWFDEHSMDLARRFVKDRPQRMRNYSHIIMGGEWIPLSKVHKRRMSRLLTGACFPELVAIAVSGQKHIVFRAPRNPPGSEAGWVQFEERAIWVVPADLHMLLGLIEELLVHFSKAEIDTGHYRMHRIVNFGVKRWTTLEGSLRMARGSPLFALALFLGQSEDTVENGYQGGGSGPADGDLADDPGGVQEPVPNVDLAAVRGSGPQRGVHEQSG